MSNEDIFSKETRTSELLVYAMQSQLTSVPLAVHRLHTAGVRLTRVLNSVQEVKTQKSHTELALQQLLESKKAQE